MDWIVIGVGLLVGINILQLILWMVYLRRINRWMKKQNELLTYWLERPRRVEQNLLQHHKKLLSSDLAELDGNMDGLLKRSRQILESGRKGRSKDVSRPS